MMLLDRKRRKLLQMIKFCSSEMTNGEVDLILVCAQITYFEHTSLDIFQRPNFGLFLIQF